MKTLTVSSQLRQWGGIDRRREAIVPAVRLSGKWLARLGFAPGSKITVRVEGSTLRLEAA
jgi:hypothetical protein